MNASDPVRRHLLTLGLFSAGAALAAAAESHAAPARKVQPTTGLIVAQAGKPAVPGGFTDKTGRSRSLKDYRGRVVLLNLWSTWCAPCRLEMPALDRLAAAYPSDLAVLPVSFDGKGWDAVDDFWRSGFPYLTPYLADDRLLAEGYGALGFPFSVVLDRQGRELARLPRAAEWDRGAPRDLIAKAVSAKA